MLFHKFMHLFTYLILYSVVHLNCDQLAADSLNLDTALELPEELPVNCWYHHVIIKTTLRDFIFAKIMNGDDPQSL